MVTLQSFHCDYDFDTGKTILNERFFLNLFEFLGLISEKVGRRRGPVVRALCLHAVAPGSNPVLTSGARFS